MTGLGGSVRVRITGAVVIIFAVFMSGAAFGLVRQVQSALVNDIQVRNDVVTQALGNLLSSGRVSPSTLATSAVALQSELNEGSNSEMLREGYTQSIIYATEMADPNASGDSMLSRLRQAVTGGPTSLNGKEIPDQITADDFAISRATIRTPTGSLVLNVASPLNDIHRTVGRISRAMWFAVPVLVLMIGIITWIMTGRALRPVSDITHRVKEITGSTLNERVPEPSTDDEIGELARTMNAMLDRLESSSKRQKRFMSDASHELRSPVASIKTQLETALLDRGRTDWEQVASTVLAEDERLESLVDNLLAMARLEEGVRRPPTEVDLDEVVFEQASRPTRLPINRSRVGAGRVVGVPQEVTSVVRNLLDNAVRHARTQVRVSLATVGNVVRLAVEDDGPGIAAEDRDKVFERFTRLQEGRARDSGGSGLGLSLCRRIVEGSGGRIFVETSELGGACFVVELPSVPE